ncbi:hypothetical protein ABIE62_002757 [Porphyrobacter sp. MBR-155]|jgi:hypothetical protein
MIRHGSPCKTVRSMGTRSMPPRMPGPELARAQGVVASKSNAVCNPIPYETTPIRPLATLPHHERPPPQTIPKPLYP